MSYLNADQADQVKGPMTYAELARIEAELIALYGATGNPLPYQREIIKTRLLEVALPQLCKTVRFLDGKLGKMSNTQTTLILESRVKMLIEANTKLREQLNIPDNHPTWRAGYENMGQGLTKCCQENYSLKERLEASQRTVGSQNKKIAQLEATIEHIYYTNKPAPAKVHTKLDLDAILARRKQSQTLRPFDVAQSTNDIQPLVEEVRRLSGQTDTLAEYSGRIETEMYRAHQMHSATLEAVEHWLESVRVKHGKKAVLTAILTRRKEDLTETQLSYSAGLFKIEPEKPEARAAWTVEERELSLHAVEEAAQMLANQAIRTKQARFIDPSRINLIESVTVPLVTVCLNCDKEVASGTAICPHCNSGKAKGKKSVAHKEAEFLDQDKPGGPECFGGSDDASPVYKSVTFAEKERLLDIEALAKEKAARAEKFHDVRTHRSAWREAIEYAIATAEDLSEYDEVSKFREELKAFDALFDLLEVEFFGSVDDSCEGRR